MSKIEFHEITLDDKTWMDARFQEDDRNACEYTFANNFVWRKVYHVEVAEKYGCAIIRFEEEGVVMYSYPIGAGDRKKVIDELIAICGEEERPLIMSPLSEADREQMLTWYPEQFLIQGDRNDYDYIYSREKLATLAGKKMHGKRNHIARFQDEDDWCYEELNDSNIEECRNMTYTWIKMRAEKWNEEMELEMSVLHEAFDHRKELGLVGGIIRKAGQIVAFSIGEPLNSDTYVVHFEKAFPDMQGAYPMINQQFVLHACQNYTYVNREEDTGDLGLRKAKMSYYPEILLKKYVAISSDVIFADKERNREEIHKIWETCFGDEAELVDFYMDKRMTEDNMLLICQDGHAVSMASFLDINVRDGEEWKPAKYVYAVATLPEYRGRGYAEKILKKAEEIFNMLLVLVPAEKELVDYYRKIGFTEAYPSECLLEKQDVPELFAAELNSYSVEEITAAEYKKIREQKRMRNGFIAWDEAAIRFAMDFNCFCGGRTVKVVWSDDISRDESAEDADILMYCPENENLHIIETTLSEEQFEELLPELMAQTKTARLVYDREGIMVLSSDDKERQERLLADGYFALSLA